MLSGDGDVFASLQSMSEDLDKLLDVYILAEKTMSKPKPLKISKAVTKYLSG